MIKRFNICIKKTYTDKNGIEQKAWNRVGNLVYFPARGDYEEGYKLELYLFPTLQFSIFEDRPKENGEAEIDADTGQVKRPRPNKQLPAVVPRGQKVEQGQIEYPEEEINPDDIPF